MFYTGNVQQAQEYAARALELMQAHSIPATPENYQIWFLYASGRNPELVKAIGVLIDGGRTFTDALSHELYEHFGPATREGKVVTDTATRLQGEITEVLRHLNDAGGNADRFGSSLASFNEAMVDGRQLAEMLGQLITETRAMTEQTRALQSELAQSLAEIDQLRQNLAEIQREATTDGLTGIANRKHFDDRLRLSVTEAMETGAPLALLLCDIDFFKNFNDRWGHQLGDQVLRLVATTIRENIKGKDLAARFGGEEFAVILPGTNLTNAMKVADTVRKAVAGKKVVKRSTGESLGQVTLSIGVALFQAGEPIYELIQRADNSLYTAKRAGRNRVIGEVGTRTEDGARKPG